MKITKNSLLTQISIILWGLLLFGSSLANTNSTNANYPRGCEAHGFTYENGRLVLNLDGGQTFYLIGNQATNTIELIRHETRDVFMSPSLKTKITPDNWSAFAADIQYMQFSCYQFKNNNTELVSCEDVLDICQYPRVKFALSNMGNYWVSTNKSRSRVIKEAISKGLLLRW